jgi:hypothetical protein
MTTDRAHNPQPQPSIFRHLFSRTGAQRSAADEKSKGHNKEQQH